MVVYLVLPQMLEHRVNHSTKYVLEKSLGSNLLIPFFITQKGGSPYGGFGGSGSAANAGASSQSFNQGGGFGGFHG